MPAPPPPSSTDSTLRETWDARYRGERPPWDTGHVDRHLEQLVQAGTLTPCRVLDVGCGTGVDAIFLARVGFTVTAVDVAPTAIERARARAHEAGVDVTFAVGTFDAVSGSFDLVYDCGCFHTVEALGAREAFVAAAAACLRPGGEWLSIAGSTDGPPRDHGPPRRSATELVSILEPRFEILSLTSDTYDADIPTVARAWVLRARKREGVA